MVGPQKKRSPRVVLGTQCFELHTRLVDGHTNALLTFGDTENCILQASNLIEAGICEFVHLSVSMSISVCASKCGSFHPPWVAIQLSTTEGKVKVLQTKRQNVLTRASGDKSSPELRVWAEAQRK